MENLMQNLIGIFFLAVISLFLASVSKEQKDILGAAGQQVGARFDYMCADNGYLIGLQARVGAVIDSIQAICAKYDPATRQVYAKGPEGPVFGGPGGELMFDAPIKHHGCRNNDVIYAFDGAESGTNTWSVLARIRFACIDAGNMERPRNSAPSGSFRRIILLGSDGINEDSNKFGTCTDGRIARGFWGYAGKYLNSFGLYCVPARAPAKPKSEERSYAPGERTFINPTAMAHDDAEYLIDWCKTPAAQCGQPAARQFCASKGFSYVVDFKTNASAWRTVFPSTHDYCSGSNCTGFSEVTCSETEPKPIDPNGRVTHPMPTHKPSPVDAHSDAGLMTGTFLTDFGELHLTPQGGDYAYANGRVTVSGIHDAIMEGTWEQSTASQACPDGRFWGHFVFSFTPEGFSGFYGYCDGQLTAGKWNGTRRP